MKRGVWTTSTASSGLSRTSTVASTPQAVLSVRVNRKRSSTSLTVPTHISDLYYRAVVYPVKDTWDMLTYFSNLEIIGRGSYGEVARAEASDRFDLKNVAIKKVEILEDDHPSDWENGLRLVREIFFLKNLCHPNLSSLVCLFPNTGPHLQHIHIVTRYYNEGSLSNYHPGNVDEILSIQRQILAGLNYMHSHNVLHRDVKRENVFVERNGSEIQIVLGDFGLSRSAVKSGMTAEVVTKPYRCPSLLLGATQYGPEIDIYAAGLVLLEMLLGKKNNTLLPNRKMALRNFVRHQLALVVPKKFSPRMHHLGSQIHLDLEELRDTLVEEEGFEDKLAMEWSRQTWASIKSVYSPSEALVELGKRMVSFDPACRCGIREALEFLGETSTCEESFGEPIRESYNQHISTLSSDEEKAEAVRNAIRELVNHDIILGPYMALHEPVSRRTRLQRRTSTTTN
jgi:serine/threonine protein kinase